MTTKKTAAIYARFSSDMQKESSIEDQWSLCQRIAVRHGLKIVKKFADRAKSGASMFDRDELRALMRGIKNGEFDAVIVEDLDRLSRDKEDLAHIYKRLTFADMKLYNQMGEVSEMEADLKGIIASQFLKDLGKKIKRGLDGRADKGLFPGAVTYGYDRVTGQPGVRAINKDQAKIVRRIFTEYSAGISPRDIAVNLTRDRIPSPSGADRWSHQTFIGANYGRGMLGNRLYIGELVWNSHRSIKNPDTGKTVKRAVDDERERIVRQVPHLRIIDQKLWEAVNELRQQRAQTKFGPSGKVTRRNVIPRSGHLLSGLLQCGVCGSSMRIVQIDRKGHSRVACVKARDHRACEHGKSYDIEALKETAIINLKHLLADEKNVRDALREASRHFEVTAKTNNAERASITRQITNISVQIERVARAIVDGAGNSPTLAKMLAEREAERAGLEERLRLVSATNLSLHPNLVPKYLEAVRGLHDLLNEGQDTAELRAGFRNIIDRIAVKPTGKRMPYVVEAFGRISAMLGIDLSPPRRSNEEILISEGLTCNANGKTGLAGLPQTPHRGEVISLGIWRRPIAA